MVKVRKWTGSLLAIAVVLALLVPAAVAWADEHEQTTEATSAGEETQEEQEPAGADDGVADEDAADEEAADEDAADEEAADEDAEDEADEDGDGAATAVVDEAWVAELQARLAGVRTRIAALEAAAETETDEQTDETGETAADDDTAAVTEPESDEPADQDVAADTADGRGKGRGKGKGGGDKAATARGRSAGGAKSAGGDDTGSEDRGRGQARRAEATAKAQETLAAVAAKQVAKGNLNAAGSIISNLTRLNPEASALVSLRARLLLASHDLDGAEAVLVEALGELEGLRAFADLLEEALEALGIDPDAAPEEPAEDTTATDDTADDSDTADEGATADESDTTEEDAPSDTEE